MNKRGQFGFDTFMSYVVFGMFMFFTIIALSLSGCGTSKSEIEYGIGTDLSTIGSLRASEQLAAYLRTNFDFETLRPEIASLSRNARDFLDINEDVRRSETYSEFIINLAPYRSDADAQETFDIATQVLFSRRLISQSVRDRTGVHSDEYFSPFISVQFNHPAGFYDGSEHLVSGKVNTELSSNIVFQLLPTHANEIASVRFELTDDRESRPIP